MGFIQISARSSNQSLSENDLTLLQDVARELGIALRAAQLAVDLQNARESLVISREEERRRIRNDLHDGLAPTLSSLQLQLGALRSLVRPNPDQAEVLINEMREDLRSATAEIRQLVYDLRPPLLDELGLVSALRCAIPQGTEISFEVIAPPLPKLPAAVEVAAYRIAIEAVHNVLKHAQATACQIFIAVEDGCLVLKVIDNGRGIPGDVRTGVGLMSMKERATELGGILFIQPNELLGTCVLTRIPIDNGCKAD
jgi:signal transduction histidine kinase